jgi:hypothetical protein
MKRFLIRTFTMISLDHEMFEVLHVTLAVISDTTRNHE